MDHFLSSLSSPYLNKRDATPALVLGTCAVATVVTVQLFTKANPIGRCWTFWRQLGKHEQNLTSSNSVHDSVTEYADLHSTKTAQDRNANYDKLVNAYYDLATVFYEWGWGSSFHFSFQYPHENFDESIRRHEYQLASYLDLSHAAADKNNRPHILDVGCGIGGPLRNVSRFLQATVTGITINEYQVQRGNELTQRDIHCRTLGSKLVRGDFMKLPFADNTFDGAYAIEATCHAPDRVACYAEILRVLKPGATFACYEWCMTDKYDATNPEHLRMKKDIEQGNGLPDVCDTTVCWHALQQAGFQALVESDVAATTAVVVENGGGVQPWYTPLTASWNPVSQRFQFNWLGAIITNVAIRVMEFLYMAPVGTLRTQQILQAGGFALRDAGKDGIFTTMYLMVGKKPVE